MLPPSSCITRLRAAMAAVTLPLPLPLPAPQATRLRLRIKRRSVAAAQGRGGGVTTNLELGEPTSKEKRPGNAVYTLLLANLGFYAVDHWLQLGGAKLLYLYHASPQWYQFITATFCHYNWKHLSSNLFFLYIFGKLVEEEEGGLALWTSYLLTGAGANLVSFLVLPPNVVSIGASGAVFGLFAISVLVKLSWDWRKILEVLILGQFVVDKVLEAAQASTTAASSSYYVSSSVNHIAHCAGALAGVLLIWLLSKLPTTKENAQ